jgi:hypothetical protein
MRKHLALLTNEVSRFKSFNEAPHLARKCATRRIDSPCNTLFFKKKESYKFIYLNKYLIVALHADAYFPLCCKVLLYFILQIEVVEIQI